jgi:hypothetical protein
MKSTTLVRLALILTMIILGGQTLLAQEAPEHQAGTICFTPKGWCWASPPGLPGTACICSAGATSIQGTLG